MQHKVNDIVSDFVEIVKREWFCYHGLWHNRKTRKYFQLENGLGKFSSSNVRRAEELRIGLDFGRKLFVVLTREKVPIHH